MTYELAVKQMLLDHHDIDDLRILERQKAESARATGDTVTHDCAFCDLAKLREVIFEGLCKIYVSHCLSVTMMIASHHLRSVVSQFRPPINILLYDCQSCLHGIVPRSSSEVVSVRAIDGVDEDPVLYVQRRPDPSTLVPDPAKWAMVRTDVYQAGEWQ